MALSRTGRPFFGERATAEAILTRIRTAMIERGVWDRHAHRLGAARRRNHALVGEGAVADQDQYAATGAAARAG
jgi:hypothetical protein